MTQEKVKLVRDADGAYCLTCNIYFDEVTNNPVPWSWRKSQWMHQQGTGHTMQLYRLA